MPFGLIIILMCLASAAFGAFVGIYIFLKLFSKGGGLD